MVVTNTGAPQGDVLAPFLITLYMAVFSYNSYSCHIQKSSDDTAIAECITSGNEHCTGLGWADKNTLYQKG